MNRRHFLKAASGLFVAASAGLIVPERKVWALDRTMIQPEVRRFCMNLELDWDHWLSCDRGSIITYWDKWDEDWEKTRYRVLRREERKPGMSGRSVVFDVRPMYVGERYR